MSKEAFRIANEILGMELALFNCSNRHTGIIGAHAELWCENFLEIDLCSTGISRGSDGQATDKSPFPMKRNDAVQIKGRSKETMHVTFNPDPVDWLCVIEYDWNKEPVGIAGYLFSVEELAKLADSFETEEGYPAMPLRYKGKSLRIEWCILKGITKTGRVKNRGPFDTWEKRKERTERLISIMYTWNGKEFINQV